MANPASLELRVGIDVGSRCHNVAIGLSDGRLLEEFDITHTAAGFDDFFQVVSRPRAETAMKHRLPWRWKVTMATSDPWTVWFGPEVGSCLTSTT